MPFEVDADQGVEFTSEDFTGHLGATSIAVVMLNVP
jgi:hypothetical protein